MTNKAADPQAEENSTVGEADKKRAKAWFDRANAAADARNYDYAIQCFISGLDIWPDAVDEGHAPLRLVSMQRRQAGGKKPGIFEAMKYPVSGKDSTKAMMNAEFLLAKDPGNVNYMEALFKNAGKSGLKNTVAWIGPTFMEACQQEKKPSVGRFLTLRSVYEELSNRCEEEDDLKSAIDALQHAVQALEFARQINPQDRGIGEDIRNLSSRLTMLKGNYGKAGSFRDSIADAEGQRDMQDRERIVQSGDRLDQLVARARADLEANPGVPPKIIALADALAKREQPKQEDEAVALLLGAYKDLGDYTFKRRADDLRIKQMTREARRIVASKDRDAAQRHLAKQLTFEIEVFSERVKQYPTDSGLKYQLAQRMLRAKRIDDAIPLFQEARGDAKHRVQANVSIGRCFFEKGYYPQAINTFTEVIREYEMPGDEVSKEMHYWLGRSYEAADKKDEAVETYGHLIELDYNYKDVRERLDALSKHEE